MHSGRAESGQQEQEKIEPARARVKTIMQFFVCEVLVYPYSSSHRVLMARL